VLRVKLPGTSSPGRRPPECAERYRSLSRKKKPGFLCHISAAAAGNFHHVYESVHYPLCRFATICVRIITYRQDPHRNLLPALPSPSRPAFRAILANKAGALPARKKPAGKYLSLRSFPELKDAQQDPRRPIHRRPSGRLRELPEEMATYSLRSAHIDSLTRQATAHEGFSGRRRIFLQATSQTPSSRVR